MNLGDLLTPWVMLAGVIIPLVYVEKWIHAHLYGVGWLMTNDKRSATALYYVLLFPGVLVHEFTQYLVAGALNVKIKRVIAWPQAQADGTLRLDFVQIKNANRIQAAIIGAAPLFTGLALVWLISSQLLSLDNVVNAVGTGNLDTIGATLRDAASAPDFLLWIYVIFTISNAMLPTPADRQGWPLLVGVFAVVIGFLVLIGVGDVLMETFTGPVAHGVNRLTTAFATVLIAEVPGILAIGFVEEVLEKSTKRKFEYGEPSTARSRRTERQPGSNLPLPTGTPLPSIYRLDLPILSPSEVKALPSRSRVAAATSRSAPAVEGAPSAASDERPSLRRDQPLPGAQPGSQFTRRSGPPGEDQPATSDEHPSLRRDQPSPGAQPGGPIARRSGPPGEDQPATSDEHPSLRRDRPSPGAQPGSQFTRRSGPPGEDQLATSNERPSFRRDQPSPGAQPGGPFARRSSPPSEDQPPVRPTFRPSAPADDTSAEDDQWLSGFKSQQRPSAPLGGESPGDRPSGMRRPGSPFASRPSPFGAGRVDDEDEDEDVEDDEEVVYEDFDDDSVLDNVYDEDDE
jgi:hypothetical protein